MAISTDDSVNCEDSCTVFWQSEVVDWRIRAYDRNEYRQTHKKPIFVSHCNHVDLGSQDYGDTSLAGYVNSESEGLRSQWINFWKCNTYRFVNCSYITVPTELYTHFCNRFFSTKRLCSRIRLTSWSTYVWNRRCVDEKWHPKQVCIYDFVRQQ